MQGVVDLVRGGREPRDDFAGGEAEDVGDRLRVAVGDLDGGFRVPVRRFHRLDEDTCLFLGRVGGGSGGVGLVKAECFAQSGQ